MTRDKQRSSVHLLGVVTSLRRLYDTCRSGALVAGLLCVGLTTPAAAKVCQHNASATKISPPPDLREEELESNDNIHVFAEKSGLLLGSGGVTVNTNSYGSHNNDSLGSPFAVAGGVKVDSDYIHFDPEGGVRRVNGSVVFCEPILGVIAKDAQLRDSRAAFGVSGTTYPETSDNEGIEGDGDKKRDFFEIFKVDGEKRGLSFSFRASLDIDTLRVITEAAPPAPVV